MVRSEEKVCAEETQMNLLHLVELCSVTVITKMYRKERKMGQNGIKNKKN